MRSCSWLPVSSINLGLHRVGSFVRVTGQRQGEANGGTICHALECVNAMCNVTVDQQVILYACM